MPTHHAINLILWTRQEKFYQHQDTNADHVISKHESYWNSRDKNAFTIAITGVQVDRDCCSRIWYLVKDWPMSALHWLESQHLGYCSERFIWIDGAVRQIGNAPDLLGTLELLRSSSETEDEAWVLELRGRLAYVLVGNQASFDIPVFKEIKLSQVERRERSIPAEAVPTIAKVCLNNEMY